MVELIKIVTSLRERGVELPEWASEFVARSKRLAESGKLEEIEKWVRLNRTGYQGFDVVMFVVAYFSSGLNCGFKEFWKISQPYGEKLAALWGRSKWPTQPAISRALKKADMEEVQAFADWVLLGDVSELETFSSVAYHDSYGKPWMVFHWDPKDHVFHQRALPNRSDDPKAIRRSEQISAPGYTGRKRGNAVLSHSKLQHSGTGLWHGVTLRPGNALVREDFAGAVEQVERWAESRSWDREHTMIVVDGDTNGWPQTDLGCRSEVAVLTRLSYYKFLEVPRVAKVLRRAKWEVVDDSGSGPVRYAADAGIWRGCRLIVSRFLSEDANGSGKAIDDWHYEMFVLTDLSSAWSPADLVALYYARCGLENQFAAENKEFGLDKIFSYTEAGQLLCVTLGMWVWNLQTLMGAALAEGEGEVLDQEPLRLPREQETYLLEYPEFEGPDDVLVPDVPKFLEKSLDSAVVKSIWHYYVDIESELSRFPSWSFESDSKSLICPSGHRAVVFNARRHKKEWQIRFQTLATACRGCPARAQCTKSQSPQFRKQLEIRIPFDRGVLTTGPNGKNVLTYMRNEAVEPPERVEFGPLAVEGPRLLFSELRKRAQRAFRDSRASVTIQPGPASAPPTPYLATTARERSHRRQTWEERFAWNAANHERVSVNLATIAPLPGVLA